MIHSLAQHGVLPTDLAPSLVTTQTVDNPDFDPEAERERDEEREQQEQLDAERKEKEGQEKETTDEERGEGEVQEGEREEGERAREGPSHDKEKIESEEGEGADTGKAEKEALDETEAEEQRREESEGAATARLEGEAAGDLGDPFADEYAGGDLGSSGDADVKREIVETDAGQSLSADIANEEGSGDLGTDASTPTLAAGPSTPTIPDSKRVDPEEKDAFSAAAASAGSDRTEEKRSSRIIADPNTTTRVLGSATADDIVDKTTPMGLTNQPQTIDTLPSALEGVTTELSSADRKITLDLRWTVLCDLFLVLTADSVYDSRSRVLLEKVAEHLGLAWMDVTKFEKRVTDALEIEEGVAGSLRGKKAVKKRAEAARRRRLVMMGLATVGGGLVIGLSAGLMAPFIGAGLGAALGTIGVGGTTGFLGGVGGAAIITTTGTVGGAALGGRGMSRRTRSVKTFEFKPIHNNKRVNCIVTVGGFMSGPQDDPRLPFSVVDSIMGDVFSVLWEPEMMQEMGDAIYLLWNETIVQGLQQVLAATIAGGLVGALAWPLWLTKLGYFIDNPWSNALDRAHACGLILADVLSRRQLGVRPITLVGFSLGARAIFYCLVELAQKKKFGIVQNVYLMGAPVTASDKTWKEARAVVAGRFVNAFSRTDWILGYLFRATTGGLRSIAGLHPVERVPEVENIDVTQTVPGHLQYRAFMPLVLDELGFRTTADYFDEPEDLSKVPEREIVYEQEEPEAVKEMKAVKTSSGGFGQIFKRKKTADGQGTSSGSSSNNSSTDHGAGPSIKSPTSPAPPSKLATQVSGGDGDDDDDDLPPREEHSPSYPVEEPKTPTLSQPAVPNKPASNMPPQSGASSGDADLDAILAELRESGIEVKELQSSLPPLPLAKPTTPSGSQTPSKDVSVSTGKQSKEQQEASSSLEPPSTAATKANLPRMQNQQQAQTLSPSSPALDGPSTAGEDKQPSSRPRLPYAKSFGSTVFDVDELPPLRHIPRRHSRTRKTSRSHLEEEKDKGEAELERIASGSAYGLSEETARELARQFQSSGMSTQGARAAAKMAQTLGQGSSDYSPAAPTAASPALDPWSSGGAGAGDGEDEEAAASAVASSGFAPLSAPERSFSFGRQTDDEAFSSASAESRYGGKGRGGLDLQPQQDPWVPHRTRHTVPRRPQLRIHLRRAGWNRTRGDEIDARCLYLPSIALMHSMTSTMKPFLPGGCKTKPCRACALFSQRPH
ncbi:hypothetical protein L7F22_059393 [Adiantum nelumboides]|nr:hypothetical protein [Adiantum nelumboides]